MQNKQIHSNDEHISQKTDYISCYAKEGYLYLTILFSII
jgi:hypothetical protein